MIYVLMFAAIAALAYSLHSKHRELGKVMDAKHAADDKCAAALKERDAAEESRASMASKFDPVVAANNKIRERHADALNELYEETLLHKQRANTLALVIEKMMPDMAISEARKMMILKQIEFSPMMDHIITMNTPDEETGAANGEAERSAPNTEA